MNNDAFSAGTETANTDIRFLKASGSRVWRYISRWTGGRVSRVFWCLFNDDIPVTTRRLEEGRVVRGEIRDRDKWGGGTGRVTSLVVLSHRIGATEQNERPGKAAFTAISARYQPLLVSFHHWLNAQPCFTTPLKRVSAPPNQCNRT